MADDRDPSQQTEEPTAKRLEQAHEHGDVVKSPEVSAFIMLLGGTIAIMMFGGSVMTKLAGAMRIFLEQPDQMGTAPGDLMQIARYVSMSLLTILGPVFAVMMAAAVGGHVLQSRPGFSLEKIKPDFSKLNIFSALTRMFGMDGL